MQVNIISDGGKLPVRATPGSAAYDLFTPSSGTINSKNKGLIKLGIRIKLNPGTCGIIESRSGLALRKGLIRMAGVIDEDYRGEVCVLLYNSGDYHFNYNKGDRIAQLVIYNIVQNDNNQIVDGFSDDEVDDIDEVDADNREVVEVDADSNDGVEVDADREVVEVEVDADREVVEVDVDNREGVEVDADSSNDSDSNSADSSDDSDSDSDDSDDEIQIMTIKNKRQGGFGSTGNN